jgi:hypothetical protein
LDLVPAERMHLVVTKFGNLTENDAIRLADAIEREAAEWQPVLLGLAAGVPPADDVPRAPLSVEVDGDLDALQPVIRGVPRIAQGLHLFVDRRAFAPFLTVGHVNDLTTPAYVDAVLDVVDAMSAVTWTQSVLSLLLNVQPTPEQPGLRLFREVPLGPAPR